MVKLTTAYVEKKCSQTQSNKSLSKEMDKDYVKKITHLFMDNKFISTIGNLSLCSNLKVMYLQNNCIRKIENLHFAKNLTHLYLQHNNLTKIENLDSITNLTKLYLGYNSISIVEGLENLECLKELHIEKQRLDPGDSLYFEPRSSITLSACLKVLNITGNRITSLNEISNFKKLEILEAKNNLIKSIADVTYSISRLFCLRELSLQGNPVTKMYRYRESVIANHDYLANLDGKQITESCKSFLKRFQIELQQTRKRPPQLTLSDDIASALNLPPAFKRSISRAIFQHVGPKFASLSVTSVNGGELDSQFPPWKTSAAVTGSKDNHTLPRPFWKSLSNKNWKKSVNKIPRPGQGRGTFLSILNQN